jgi:integrase
VRVRLRGINSRTKVLADGRRVTYWWAWKGGPRLEGEPGSPEFIASYNAAHAAKIEVPAGELLSVIRYYETTSEFTKLAERTRKDYRKHIAAIEAEFGDLPIAALNDTETRGVFKEWRDRLAEKSDRQADYAWTVLARVLAVAKDRGKFGITTNPCEKGGRLYAGSRRDVAWSFEDEELYCSMAPAHLYEPLLMGAWTGQREGDLLRVPKTAYDGSWLRLRQRKTGTYVEIPVIGPLKVALDAAVRRNPDSLLILNNSYGRPWTEAGFRSSFFKFRDKVGLKGRTFHDLRGTAVTRLTLAGCTVPEVSVFTGLSPDDVQQILVKHYLNRDPAIAKNASEKLAKLAETRTKLPTG